MAEPLRHRQTKEAVTDMFSLQPPRHISTLPIAPIGEWSGAKREWTARETDAIDDPGCVKTPQCEKPLECFFQIGRNRTH
jgi:hypothetical protein